MLGGSDRAVLKGAAFVRGGRYGVSIDFGLEVAGKKRDCDATLKSKLIALSHEVWPHNRRILTRDRTILRHSSLEFLMALALGTRKRPPQSRFVQTGFWEITPEKSARVYECFSSGRVTPNAPARGGRLLASRGGGWNEQTREGKISNTKEAQDKTRSENVAKPLPSLAFNQMKFGRHSR